MRIRNAALAAQYLARYPVEELFSFPVRDALYVHAIESGEYLFRYDDALNRLYFLVEGRSKSYVVHANGSVSLLAFSGPGTIMGDMELIGSIADDYLVQAVAPCIAIELDLRNCREQVLNDAKFLRLLARLFGNKLYRKDQHLSASQTLTTKQALAQFILLMQTGGIFSEPLTTTAQYLGVNYRHLQRVIAELCTSGILERLHRAYRICDTAALTAIAPDTASSTDRGFLAFLSK